MASMAGKDVADSGLGRWARSQATGSRSSGFNSSPVTGHRFSEACNAFSMRRRSKRCPVFLETTGCWGISPEMAQYILAFFFFVELMGAALAGALRTGGDGPVTGPGAPGATAVLGSVTQRRVQARMSTQQSARHTGHTRRGNNGFAILLVCYTAS